MIGSLMQTSRNAFLQHCLQNIKINVEIRRANPPPPREGREYHFTMAGIVELQLHVTHVDCL